MEYSKNNTVCIYSDNITIIKKAESFLKNKSLKIYYADCETDLIGVPYLFAITDINKLGDEFFNYLNLLIKDDLVNEERFISYSEPRSKRSVQYSKYFTIDPDLNLEDVLVV